MCCPCPLSFGLIRTATASEERGDAFAEAAKSRIKEQSSVLGDSHSLVVQQGKENRTHCTGAGIADQLSQRVGNSVNLIGVRGSGLVQAQNQAFFHASETPGV